MFLPSIDLNVSERLKRDPEFRQRFFVAESSAQIARQLIALRKRRGLSQVQLAEKLGTQQPAISRVERSDYRNWSYNTLRKEAEVLDARLRVLIEPAEDVLKEYESDAVEQPKETRITDVLTGLNWNAQEGGSVARKHAEWLAWDSLSVGEVQKPLGPVRAREQTPPIPTAQELRIGAS